MRPRLIPGIHDLGAYYWEPVQKKDPIGAKRAAKLRYQAEQRLKALERWQAKWQENELRWMKMKIAVLEADLERDRRFLVEEETRKAAFDRVEAEAAEIRAWYAKIADEEKKLSRKK
jgi:hypothetical protein